MAIENELVAPSPASAPGATGSSPPPEPETTLRALVELLPIPVAWLGRTGEVRACNEAHRALEGRPDQGAWRRRRTARLLTGGCDLGTLVWYEDRVLEGERAERDLQASEGRYRSLVVQAAEGIITTDGDGLLLESNPAAAELLGRSEAEVVGLPLRSMLWFDPDAPETGVPATLADGVLRTAAIHRPDGTRRDVELSMIWLADGRQLWVLRDVTERLRRDREQAEEELRSRRSERLEAVGRLAGGLAHDFNNLLTVIFGHAEILERSRDWSTARSASAIARAADRGARLTSQLLAMSRRHPAEIRLLAVNQALSASVGSWRKLVGDDIELVLELVAALDSVLIDVGHLDRVLNNLVSNAIDAMPDGGRLSIRTHNTEQAVVLEVADTGCGMDAATCAFAVEPFFTTKPRRVGGGLGLATVQGLVLQAGGSLSFTSGLGEGTTARVELPIATEGAEGERRLPAPASATPLGVPSGTVLLVDDDDQARATAAEILARGGYRFLDARDGHEALRLAASTPIDLLLTDVVMPEVDGVALARTLTSKNPALRVVFVSSFLQFGAREVPELLRSVEYLPKPYTCDELRAKVREVLSQPPVASAAIAL